MTDLKKPPVTQDASGGDPLGGDAIGGLLGSILGGSAAEQKAKIAEATKGANDLSSLVKKKATKPVAANGAAGASGGGGAESAKRKLDGQEALEGPSGSKKARVEDA